MCVAVAACAGPQVVHQAVPVSPAVAPAPPLHPPTPTLRLPGGIAPTAYEVRATVVPSAKTMATTTTIELQLDQAIDRLWLNQTDLEFTKVTGTFRGAPVAATAKPEKAHFVAIDFVHPIGPGPATLVIESVAQLSRREGQGAFAATEYGGDFVFTQFESVGARRAFPVFDEPSFKVPWKLTLRVPKDLTAVSNTAVETEQVDGEFKVVTFARTKPMPSYLLAFGVGPFEFVDGGKAGKNQVPVRIVVPKGQAARAKWAAEVTAQVIDHLETFFGTPFPYDKADQLAVVGPGFGGAMENPGLVTWGQGLVLAGITGDTIGRRRSYLSVATHELAHHWFGDLVTAAWWDDIWLNESFADYVENKVVTAWHPEWGGAISRVEARDEVMGQDSLGSVRRIREPIVTHDDIANAFDGITYSKGASVLHMFERWLGDDVFRKGVRIYLEKHAWKNGTVGDFLGAMSEAAGRDVSGPFGTFLDQPGFPLVTTALACPKDGPVTVTLAQQRYMPLGSKLDPETWRFPVCLRWDGGRQCTLLETPSATITLETKTCPAWVLANEAMAGYYRVTPVLPALVSNAALSMEERVGVAGELSALVQKGDLSIAEQLDTVGPTFASGNRQLMEYALGSAAGLRDLLPEASKPKLAAFVQHHFGAKARAVSFVEKPGESDDEKLLRPRVLRVVGGVGADQALRAEAVKLARAWVASHASVSDELSGTALGVAARTNDKALFELELNALKKETDRRARRQLFSALGSTTDPALAKRVLELVLSKDFDTREAAGLLFGLSRNPEVRPVAFEFVKSNYDALTKALPIEWESRLISVAIGFCSQDKRAEVEAFFKPRTTKALGGPREYATAMEEFDQCVAWRQRQVPEAVKFLDHWKK